MERHQQVTLAMDIMFVNKIPFLLMTVSRCLHIRTRENIANRQVPNVANAVKCMLQLYHQSGFPVTTILANPEFGPLQAGTLPSYSIQLVCTR